MSLFLDSSEIPAIYVKTDYSGSCFFCSKRSMKVLIDEMTAKLREWYGRKNEDTQYALSNGFSTDEWK